MLSSSRLVTSVVVVSLWAAVFVNAQDLDTTVGGCPTTSGNSVCYTTYQGGISRRGLNPNEPALTQTVVTATSGKMFRKQYSVALNGAIYGQPLVLPSVVMGGTTYTDVAYVVTEQDMVYAINAAN